jgi:hypothetical protein
MSCNCKTGPINGLNGIDVFQPSSCNMLALNVLFMFLCKLSFCLDNSMSNLFNFPLFD